MKVIDAEMSLDRLSTMGERIERIVAVHHGHLRRELPRLQGLVEKAAELHAQKHPELGELREIFRGLKADIESQMLKEEWSLFPAIRRLESADSDRNLDGRLERSIVDREQEHRAVESAVERMRTLSRKVTGVVDSTGSCQALIEGLGRLEADTRQHHHEESDLLFSLTREGAAVGAGRSLSSCEAS